MLFKNASHAQNVLGVWFDARLHFAHWEHWYNIVRLNKLAYIHKNNQHDVSQAKTEYSNILTDVSLVALFPWKVSTILYSICYNYTIYATTIIYRYATTTCILYMLVQPIAYSVCPVSLTKHHWNIYFLVSILCCLSVICDVYILHYQINYNYIYWSLYGSNKNKLFYILHFTCTSIIYIFWLLPSDVQMLYTVWSLSQRSTYKCLHLAKAKPELRGPSTHHFEWCFWKWTLSNLLTITQN